MVFCDVLLDVVWGAQVFPFKQPHRDILIESYASFCLEQFCGGISLCHVETRIWARCFDVGPVDEAILRKNKSWSWF